MIQKIYLILLAFLLIGCAAQTPQPSLTAQPTQTAAPSATVTVTVSPVPAISTLTPTQPIPTATPGWVLCSPLEGIALADLADTIFNPFAPPPLGSDDPHQGIDFADIDPVYQLALEGRPVQAVIEGVVAGVIVDRFPYGNAVIVETTLEQLPAEGSAALSMPTPAAPRQGHPSLTCPESDLSLNPEASPRSIYLIYAHLQKPVALTPGEAVGCGQYLGAVGNSGNSLNPHLHLEMRVGPVGVRFESMAHYTGSASPIEMSNYCLWRVSEVFQLLDPLQLFSQSQ